MDIIPNLEIKSSSKKLSELSPNDKPWEGHRMLSDAIQNVFLTSRFKKQIRKGERMCECAPNLIFKLVKSGDFDELKHKLRYAEFCHVRLCSTCMWRKSLSWRARFHAGFPSIMQNYPKARYFHLVLTVPNCPVTELRDNLKKINKAWDRMRARKTWPALCFLRSVEVTRDSLGRAHPHVHALMMVPSTYFKGGGYMSREDWRSYWAKGLGVTPESIIHPFVRAVKGGLDEVSKAVMEVAKYAVKMKTMEHLFKIKPGREWFLELDKQIQGTKAVTLGGEIKRFINDKEITDEEMLNQDKEATEMVLKDLRYDWFPKEKHYILTKFLSEIETAWWNRQEEKIREKLDKTIH